MRYNIALLPGDAARAPMVLCMNLRTRAQWGYGFMEYMSNLTIGLVARGYSDQEIKKILGLNFLKLFKHVWGA